MSYPCNGAFSSYLDMGYYEWSRFDDDALLEVFSVDEDGNAVDRIEAVVNKGCAHVITLMREYLCRACMQRFDDWQDVLDHFPLDEDDDEGSQSDF